MEIARKGGLITAPSGPGLSQDLPFCSEYRRALLAADLVLADSGLLCLWKKIVQRRHLTRISGLFFLQAVLNQKNWKKERTFWVMPDRKQSDANVAWLEKTFSIKIDAADVYIAPRYSRRGRLSDELLLEQIIFRRPDSIFLQIGGGVQERLGVYLKEKLPFCPSIYCTGAALAFLSGQQAKIPKWADEFFLGWLLRCLFKPRVFIPRYLKAFRLVGLLAKYGDQSPPGQS